MLARSNHSRLVATVAAAIQLGAIDCARRSVSEAGGTDASLSFDSSARVAAGEGGDSTDAAADIDARDSGGDGHDAARAAPAAIGIGSVIGLQHANINCGAPAIRAPTLPTAEVLISHAVVTSGTIRNLDTALARIRPNLRDCYAKGLEANPAEAGTVTLAFSVTAELDVRASVAAGNGLSDSTTACMVAMAHRVEVPGSVGPATARVSIELKTKN
jgi:hypothetical protein